MTDIVAGIALANAKRNAENKWSSGNRSDVRSSRPRDAANRIFDGYADVRPTYDGPLHEPGAAVFAMGSCFAREIEHALTRRGGNVISLDDSFRIPAFEREGEHPTGFFHRYTPDAMVQEFERAFDMIEAWDPEHSLIQHVNNRYLDMNFPDVGLLATPAAIRERRAVSAALVRKVVDADIVILTLGLTEGWLEIETGLAINAIAGPALVGNRDAYALRQISFERCVAALEKIVAIIRAHHRSGQFRLIVTVSPVPLTSTFTGDDVIIANMRSKSTLRAAAAAFVAGCGMADYFPSYEIVTYSDPALAWRPDRIHVNPEMVRHIIASFIDTAYRPGRSNPCADAASVVWGSSSIAMVSRDGL